MIHVDFDPNKLPRNLKEEWDQLQIKANSEIIKTIKIYETEKEKHPDSKPKIDWDSSIWTDIKNWLLKNIFHGKCAYCETRLARQFPDAEHFRPKGAVNYKNDNGEKLKVAMCRDERGKEIEHPGYFWLAYNWKNLLPSCKFCNSGEGKKNQFPVQKKHVLLVKKTPNEASKLKEKPYPSNKWTNYYYLQPEDLDELEEPLLLHPYRDDPQEHLRFGHKGIEAGLSEKGSHSIDVYNLKDDELRQLRDLAQTSASNKFFIAYLNAQHSSNNLEEAKISAWESLTDVKKGEAAYIAAINDYINLCCETLGKK